MTRKYQKRIRNRRIYSAAGALAVAALLGIAGIYEYQQAGDESVQENVSEAGDASNETVATDNQETAQDETAEVSTAQIENRQTETTEDTDDTTTQTEGEETETEETETVKTSATASFTAASTLSKPVDGEVLMEFSMDKSIYFQTLNQYKYNPAVILSANVNDSVFAAAAGTVTDISVNEETGTTLTMDLGNGYTAVYGQLKETQAAVGDYVTEGTVIGYVNEPTKYYTKEGCNLYFELDLNDEPIDPMVYMQ